MVHKKIINAGSLAKAQKKQSKQFLIVENPGGVYPPVEYYPLRSKPAIPLKKLTTVLLDMDGTLSTTEELNLHALQHVTRSLMPDEQQLSWPGLDPQSDYPQVIGTSTTKSVEYLLGKYGSEQVTKSFLSAYFSAVYLSLLMKEDDGRKPDVLNTLKSVFGAAISEKVLKTVVQLRKNRSLPDAKKIGMIAARDASSALKSKGDLIVGERIRCAIDIFFNRYHEIMRLVKQGRTAAVHELLGNRENRLPISPIAGVLPFLLVLKGLLPDDYELCKRILEKAEIGPKQEMLTKSGFNKLQRIARKLSAHPVKTGVVTSSTRFEAEIVLKELFSQLRTEITTWKIPATEKRKYLQHFADPSDYFDVVVSANDSSETRLKPHRDLYTIALGKLGISENELDSVIGFEDSPSGTMSLRAAGVGLSIAVPYTPTTAQNFEAAHYILSQGLMEALLSYNIFIA